MQRAAVAAMRPELITQSIAMESVRSGFPEERDEPKAGGRQSGDFASARHGIGF